MDVSYVATERHALVENHSCSGSAGRPVQFRPLWKVWGYKVLALRAHHDPGLPFSLASPIPTLQYSTCVCYMLAPPLSPHPQISPFFFFFFCSVLCLSYFFSSFLFPGLTKAAPDRNFFRFLEDPFHTSSFLSPNFLSRSVLPHPKSWTNL